MGPSLRWESRGAGSYGAELARVLAAEGFEVREVNRPKRAHRRLHGKSDPIDAYQAAEAALAGRGTSTRKSRDGYVEALRVLRTARTSAMKARTAVVTQISAVLAAAPESVRAKYRGQTSEARARTMAGSRPSGDIAEPAAATFLTLKRMGQRYQYLTAEINETDAELARIIATHAPALTHITGVGTMVASQLLVTIGDRRFEGPKALSATALDVRDQDSLADIVLLQRVPPRSFCWEDCACAASIMRRTFRRLTDAHPTLRKK
jgi:transposase